MAELPGGPARPLVFLVRNAKHGEMLTRRRLIAARSYAPAAFEPGRAPLSGNSAWPSADCMRFSRCRSRSRPKTTHGPLKPIAKYPAGKQASAVIPLLWRAQEQEGWVTRSGDAQVAEMLDMAYIRVLEVATFYTMFQLAPVGTHAHVQVCGTTPCKLRGADALIEACQRRIHPEPHHLSADGTLSWEEVECLGACVNAPMIMVGKDTWEDSMLIGLTRVLDGFASGQAAKVAVRSSIASYRRR